MVKRSVVVAAFFLILVALPAVAVSPNVVISQVYGGGNNTGATYRNDFVEVFNRGAAAVSLTGMSVQYASATGTGTFGSNGVATLSGTLSAGQYYLVQLAGGTTNGIALPTPDATYTSPNLSGTGGKVVLVNSASGLACNGGSDPCDSSETALIIDLVGYGTANFFEGAAAPTLSNSTAAFRAAGGCTDTDNNSSDFAAATPSPRNTATALAPCAGDAAPSVTSTTPGSGASCIAPTTNVTVTFSEAVNVAGTWFTISCTSSGAHTATVSGGPTTYTLDPDADFSAGESCTVTIVAAQVSDQDATDPPDTMAADHAWTFSTPGGAATPIHDIQGSGAASPLAGAVTTRGIVTGVKSNGFFIQEPDASADADPLTSEGIFVFTSSAPPVEVVVGNLLEVKGTIQEFVPSADPNQEPLTELTSASLCLISTGNALPTAIPLTAILPDPTGAFDQLERLEGMRVSVASLTVCGPTLGNVNESAATATSTGVFFGVVTGIARPFREAGIQWDDPGPDGTIPRWDTNPELIRVDSDGVAPGSLIDVGTGAVVTGLMGPLDYSFRRYTILPEPATVPGVSGGPTLTAAPAPTVDELTVASFNFERLFDDVNDPGIGEPVLSTAAFNNRLGKISLAIRDFLRLPDIIGAIEVENLATLQAVATRVNADEFTASGTDPLYQAFLVEGNDVGGIDVGFLVKTAIVAGSTPRVAVASVTQENAGELFVNPDTSTSLLNDRPPLVLEATVSFADGRSYPIAVIVVHQRSLSGVSDEAPGSNGWATGGRGCGPSGWRRPSRSRI